MHSNKVKQLIKLFVKYHHKNLRFITITSDDYDDDLIDLKTIKYISKCVNLHSFINTQTWGIPISGLELISSMNLVVLKISTVNLLVAEFLECFKSGFHSLKVLGITNFRDELIEKSELLGILSRFQVLELDW